MAGRQVFYVTQDSLAVWLHYGTTVECSLVFSASDAGLRDFIAYLRQNVDGPIVVLVDVIEEEFSVDSIPVLGSRDRSALVQRRLQRKFPRTPYRGSRFLGKHGPEADEHAVVYSAVSNPELLDPWIQAMLDNKLSIAEIHSVPLIAADVIGRLGKNEGAMLLLSQHQDTRLRQVYLRDGQVQSARLSQSPDVNDPDYAAFVVSESLRSRRYLERTRLLNSLEPLTVSLIAEPGLAEKIARQTAGSDAPAFQFISTRDVARKSGLRHCPRAGQHEALFVSHCARSRVSRGYANSGETRYHTMRRIRQVAIASAISLAFLFSAVSGLYFSDAWQLHSRAETIETQVLRLSETLRRENERYEPIKADSHEMKVTVDTGDFILANRVPVPWVMLQLGMVMGDFPDIRILNLSWQAEAGGQDSQPVRRRTAEPLPVSIPETASVTASVTARITDYDGDLRAAFERIDLLVAALRQSTAFNDVAAAEYPVDARPQVALNGELGKGAENATAEFRLLMTYRLPANEDGDDEAI